MSNQGPILENVDGASSSRQRRKLRVLIITMGGSRREILQEFFEQPAMAEHFEVPTFVPGIPSRSLRNRESFFRHCRNAGLLPDAEWEAMERAFEQQEQEQNDTNAKQQQHDRFFDCLANVPVQGRRRGGSDAALHYSVELWRKAKTINRGRAVLACALAHLTALQKLTANDDDYDVLLEDNVRMPTVESCFSNRMWETIDAVTEWEQQQQHRCHMRYFGWLGSVTNLDWIYSSHIPRSKHLRDDSNDEQAITVSPMPTNQDILEADLPAAVTSTELKTESCNNVVQNRTNEGQRHHQQPGGNLFWGAYAYWISKDAYESVMDTLRNDVGALLWKGKRMRYYQVKPIDKILPRQISRLFGAAAVVQLSTHPTFFRAPMLTSKIHTQWDAEFAKSTDFQLKQTGMTWNDLYLTATERQVVSHHEQTGQWLTPAQLNGVVCSENEQKQPDKATNINGVVD